MPCPGQLPRRSVCEPSRILEKPGVQRHAATCQMAPQQINPKGLALWQEIGGAHVAPAGEDSPLPGLIDRNFELTILFVTEVGLIINQLAKLCLEGFNDPSVVEQLQQSNVCHCRGHLGPFVDRWQRQRFQDFGLDELLTLGNRLLPIVAAATADVQRRSWPRNAKEKKGEKKAVKERTKVWQGQRPCEHLGPLNALLLFSAHHKSLHAKTQSLLNTWLRRGRPAAKLYIFLWLWSQHDCASRNMVSMYLKKLPGSLATSAAKTKQLPCFFRSGANCWYSDGRITVHGRRPAFRC